MMYPLISVGDICKVVAHESECASIAAARVSNPDQIRWVPNGAHVLVVQTLSSRGALMWCNTMFDNDIVEISSDILRPI